MSRGGVSKTYMIHDTLYVLLIFFLHNPTIFITFAIQKKTTT